VYYFFVKEDRYAKSISFTGVVTRTANVDKAQIFTRERVKEILPNVKDRGWAPKKAATSNRK
jgi:hypothetical protein